MWLYKRKGVQFFEFSKPYITNIHLFKGYQDRQTKLVNAILGLPDVQNIMVRFILFHSPLAPPLQAEMYSFLQSTYFKGYQNSQTILVNAVLGVVDAVNLLVPSILP